jgi:hypothetical protein
VPQGVAAAKKCSLLLCVPTGSERIKKTQAAAGLGDTNYEQLRESSCINKSLSFLEQVVSALARGDAHVPFRLVHTHHRHPAQHMTQASQPVPARPRMHRAACR